MLIYHGSGHVIEKPQYGFGNVNNDYGLGFYCTESLEMAQEWSAVHGRSMGWANAYEFDCESLSVLRLDGPDYTALHWLAVLLENRVFSDNHALARQAKDYLTSTFAVDYDGCDVIVGNRADDSYFSFAKDFLNGAISYQQLRRAMDLGKLGRQVVVKSPKAFDGLSFIEAVEAPTDFWLPRRLNRDARARADYFDLSKNGFDKNGLFIQDILREEMTPGDARLQ